MSARIGWVLLYEGDPQHDLRGWGLIAAGKGRDGPLVPKWVRHRDCVTVFPSLAAARRAIRECEQWGVYEGFTVLPVIGAVAP